MHHMIEYIRDEPELLARTFRDADAAVRQLVDGVRADRWRRLVVVGIGSSYNAALMAVPAFRLHSPIPVEVLPSTELTYYAERWLEPGTIVLSVSRSGERGWVVEAQQAARAAGAYAVAMTGIADSLLADGADLVLPTSEGLEITFSKTKSVMTCAGLLVRLALCLAPAADVEAQRRLALLESLPGIIDETMRLRAEDRGARLEARRDRARLPLWLGRELRCRPRGCHQDPGASFVPTRARTRATAFTACWARPTELAARRPGGFAGRRRQSRGPEPCRGHWCPTAGDRRTGAHQSR